MEVFRPLNWVLLGSGCQLFYENHFFRILNRVVVVFILIFQSWHLYLKSSVIQFDRFFLSQFMWPLYFLLGLPYIYIMNKNRKHLNNLLNTLISQLDHEARRSLWFFSVLASIVAFGRYINYIICYLYIVIQGEKLPYLGNESDNVLLCMSILMLHNWRLGGCLVYIFFIKVIDSCERSFFEIMENSLSSNKFSFISPDYVCLRRRKMVEFKRALVSYYSIIPVLFYLQEFVYMSGTLLVYQSIWHKRSFVFVISAQVLPLVTSSTSLVYLCITAGNSCQFVQEKLDKLMTLIIERKKSDLWHDFLIQIEQERHFSYSAWNLFPSTNLWCYTSYPLSLPSLFCLFNCQLLWVTLKMKFRHIKVNPIIQKIRHRWFSFTYHFCSSLSH